MDINWLDPNYLPWLIPVPPLISFLLIILAVGRNKTLSHIVALGSVILSWIMAWGLYIRAAFNTQDFGYAVYGDRIDWMELGSTVFRMGVLVDPLTAVMVWKSAKGDWKTIRI